MKERRLLERISAWEDGGQRTNQTQVDVLVKSVTDHLRRLLNTRQGSVQLDPLFGVPDFTNIAGGLNAGSTGDIEAEITRMVLKYEPRLKSPKVALRQDASDLLSIQFALEGTLEVDDREIPLQLSTTVGSSGRVNIS
ncbi:MAG: type VI secretion system baseplate subunit TssE [Polaromonas sp.]